MSRPTDHRNLDLWDLNHDVLFGRAGGKVLWQPRILCWFTDRNFRREPLPEPYRGMSPPQVYQALGCSNRIYDYGAAFRPVEPAGVIRACEPIEGNRTCHRITTPVGTVTYICHPVPDNWYPVADKRWIETPDDMRVFTWLADHTEWAWSQETYEQVCATWGRLGAPHVCMPRVNVQDLYVNTMGVEAAVYALYEWGDVVKDYFRALHENHLRLIDVICRSPIRIVNYGDNLHGATLSPRLYEEYVLPAYLDRSERLHRSGKFVHAHWDGDTHTLLRYARCSGLDGIEAITPQPQGDVTLDEIQEALGDQVYLIDGIPAVYFDPMYPEETLLECVEALLQRFAPRLVLGISDEICSTGDLERIRLVGKQVDDYNAALTRCERAPHGS